MPHLLIQLAVVAAWIGVTVVAATRKVVSTGAKVGLLTAPVAVVGWAGAYFVSLMLVCAFQGSCI
jgi:hypothetical protein